MLNNLFNKNIFFCLIFFFLTEQTFAKNEYYKCPEKINTVLSGENQAIKKDTIIGVNYVKLSNLSTSSPTITIKFKEHGSKHPAKKIIQNKKASNNSLGFETFSKINLDGSSVENTYNFIKLNDTYAFSRKEFYWSPNVKNQTKKSYEYESSGRCLRIKANEFEKEITIKVAKKKDQETQIKTKKTTTSKKIIKGERPIAISWEGYDDLILGKVKFSERDLVGTMVFTLPKNGKCIGTYALSKKKGTWSIYCEDREVNASGMLEWNHNTGSVTGNGKDSEGKKIKFKVAEKN